MVLCGEMFKPDLQHARFTFHSPFAVQPFFHFLTVREVTGTRSRPCPPVGGLLTSALETACHLIWCPLCDICTAPSAKSTLKQYIFSHVTSRSKSSSVCTKDCSVGAEMPPSAPSMSNSDQSIHWGRRVRPFSLPS